MLVTAEAENGEKINVIYAADANYCTLDLHEITAGTTITVNVVAKGNGKTTFNSETETYIFQYTPQAA